MANFDLYFPKLIQSEGGFVNNPKDPGGATKYGVTLANFLQYGRDVNHDGHIDVNDLKLMTPDDAKAYYLAKWWNVYGGKDINNQALAEIYMDHAINAGPTRAAKMMQFILKYQFLRDVAIDGKLGQQTVGVINAVTDQARLFNAFSDMRKAYYAYRANEDARDKSKDSFFSSMGVTPSDTAQTFYSGWINRVDSFGKKKV